MPPSFSSARLTESHTRRICTSFSASAARGCCSDDEASCAAHGSSSMQPADVRVQMRVQRPSDSPAPMIAGVHNAAQALAQPQACSFLTSAAALVAVHRCLAGSGLRCTHKCRLGTRTALLHGAWAANR